MTREEIRAEIEAIVLRANPTRVDLVLPDLSSELLAACIQEINSPRGFGEGLLLLTLMLMGAAEGVNTDLPEVTHKVECVKHLVAVEDMRRNGYILVTLPAGISWEYPCTITPAGREHMRELERRQNIRPQ